MQLIAVEIEGFRGYATPTRIKIDDFTVLAGRNDAGKSSIFDALKLFLGKNKPDPLDHSVSGPGHIRITCTFSRLPPSLVIDESASTTLKAENLLDDAGNLRITKTWNRSKNIPEVSAWAMHPVGDELPFLIGQKQGQLKDIADQLEVTEKVLDRRANLSFRQAIWQEWASKGLATTELVEIPLNVADGKQVAQALESVFPIFHVFQADRVGSESEDIAQDPAKLVVASVLERHTERLAALTADVQSEIETMLTEVVDRLDDIAPELASKLMPSNIKPVWQKAFSALQFVDHHQVPLSKRGSGTRRLVLLSFFRAEVEREYKQTDGWRRGIIIAVEEPETALHPDLQRETLTALAEVSSLMNRQVLLTTHSSNLIRNIPIEAVRFVENIDGQRRWMSLESATAHEILARLTETMGTFTDHKVRCFFVVEGKNDISGILNLGDSLHALAPDTFPCLRSAEQRGEICFIPIGGCGAAALWESRLSPFSRKEVHLLDSDRISEGSALKPDIAAYAARYAQDTSSRTSVTILERREMENYLTLDSINMRFSDVPGFEEQFINLISGLDWKYADIPHHVARALHAVRSPNSWENLSDEAQGRKESKVKENLATCFQHPTVARQLLDAEVSFDLLNALNEVVETIAIE